MNIGWIERACVEVEAASLCCTDLPFSALSQEGPATILTAVKKKVKNVGIFLKVRPGLLKGYRVWGKVAGREPGGLALEKVWDHVREDLAAVSRPVSGQHAWSVAEK